MCDGDVIWLLGISRVSIKKKQRPETLGSVLSLIEITGKKGSGLCFFFERVRAPRHFLLCKGHPLYEEIVNF